MTRAISNDIERATLDMQNRAERDALFRSQEASKLHDEANANAVSAMHTGAYWNIAVGILSGAAGIGGGLAHGFENEALATALDAAAKTVIPTIGQAAGSFNQATITKYQHSGTKAERLVNLMKQLEQRARQDREADLRAHEKLADLRTQANKLGR